MTRNELRELWFTIPHKKKKTMKTIVVNINSGEVKLVNDGNNYWSMSSIHDKPLIYALNLDKYKTGEYKLVIK